MRSSLCRLGTRPLALTGPSIRCRASFSSQPARQFLTQADSQPKTELSPRWLSDFQAQLKQASAANLPKEATAELDRLAKDVGGRWLDLLAGSEGYLTEPEWRGLNNHMVGWGDMDAMGHVNNVIYNKWAEAARVNWVLKFAALAAPEHKQQWVDLMSPRSIGLIMRSIKTEYKLVRALNFLSCGGITDAEQPVTYPDRVTVLHKLTRRPDYTSDALYFDVLVLSDAHRRIAARCVEDIVVYDYRAAKRAPLEPFMVDRLRETFDEQERNKERRQQEVRSLFSSLAEIGRAH